MLLALLHAGDVLVQAGQLVTRLGGVEAQQLGQAVAVGGVLQAGQGRQGVLRRYDEPL